METLADRIARDGPVKELDAVGWAIRLAKRLEALHSLGVAHGSVSPACIITTGVERTARAYLADVQFTTSNVAFQSPERILGGDLSPADDTWAVACTLYTVLTAVNPYAAASEADLKQKILAAQPSPLAVFDVGDDDLQHIIDRAFNREMGQRTTSVNALRRALEEWHPDPGVGALSPLDDEDASEGDDDRTQMRSPAAELPAYLNMIRGQAPARPAPAPAPAPPPPVAALPRANVDDDDDDEEDDARTRMREFQVPAGLSPMGGPPAAPAPFGGARPLPAAGRAAPAPPEPAAARPVRPGAKATLQGMPGSPMALGFGTSPMAPIVAPSPQQRPPAVHDDDDEDEDDARTMMRGSTEDEGRVGPARDSLGSDPRSPRAFGNGPAPRPAAGGPPPAAHPIDDEDSDIRTVMREPEPGDGWVGGVPPPGPPPPGAPPPAFAGFGPPGEMLSPRMGTQPMVAIQAGMAAMHAMPQAQPNAGWNDPAPAKTMAFDNFELPQIPPDPSMGQPSPMGQPPMGFGPPGGPRFDQGPIPPSGPLGLSPGPMAPFPGAPGAFPGSQGAPGAFPGSQGGPGPMVVRNPPKSRRGMLIAAVVALLVAAALTFVFLKFRALVLSG